MSKKRIIGCLVLYAFLAGWKCQLAGTEHPFPTNLELFNLAVDSAAQECMSRFHFQTERKILLKRTEPSDVLPLYVVSRLCMYFQKRGLSVFSESDSASYGDRLVLSVVKAAVEYEKIPKRGLWRKLRSSGLWFSIYLRASSSEKTIVSEWKPSTYSMKIKFLEQPWIAWNKAERCWENRSDLRPMP